MEKQLLEKFVSGHLEKGVAYRYFLPGKINYQWQWADSSLNTLLEKASLKLGELNSFAKLVPNIDLFIQLHVTKEAVVSSKIEGTRTNMDDALLPIEEISPEKRNDWLEVKNYTNALNTAITELNTLPLSSGCCGRPIKYYYKAREVNIKCRESLDGAKTGLVEIRLRMLLLSLPLIIM